MAEKVYRDLFNSIIKVGDSVLHLWCNRDSEGYARGGKSAVQYKHAKVIKLHSSTVGIEWINRHGDTSTSSIKNTTNRLIILGENKGLINSDKYQTEIKLKDIQIDKLHKSVTKEQKNVEKEQRRLEEAIKIIQTKDDKIDKIYEEMLRLQTSIDEYEKDFERFAMLDL